MPISILLRTVKFISDDLAQAVMLSENETSIKSLNIIHYLNTELKRVITKNPKNVATCKLM